MDDLDVQPGWRDAPVVGLLLLSLVLFMGKMWDGVLLEDHARYAAVAKSILATGDWITMHEGPSQLYFNKPPLYFWLTALLFKVVGPSVWAARFWSALAGLGSVLLIFGMVRAFWGRTAGLWAGLALLLCNDFLRYAAVGRLDGPQAFWMILAVYGGVGAFLRKRDWHGILPGLACGFGMLSKGPVIFSVLPIVAVLAVVGCTNAARQGISYRRSLLALVVGLLLGGAVALPWYCAVASENAGFLNHYFGHEMVERARGSWLTGKSRLYFVKVLMTHGLPWTLLAPLGGYWAFSTQRQYRVSSENRDLKRCFTAAVALWLGIMLLVAFLPPRMYGRYLVVVYPPLAVFAGLGMVWLCQREGLGGRLAKGLSGFLCRRLTYVAILAGIAMMVLPFERHQSDHKVKLAEAAPMLQEAYSKDEKVPLFHAGIHAPESVIYFHCDREARQVTSLEEALGFSLIVTSDGGFAQLAPHGYQAVLTAQKLILARRIGKAQQ